MLLMICHVVYADDFSMDEESKSDRNLEVESRAYEQLHWRYEEPYVSSRLEARSRSNRRCTCCW